MESESLTILLPAPLVQFVERYKQAHRYESHSAVIKEAIELLRQHEFVQAHRKASREVDPAWDVVTADGLADEPW